MRYLYGRRRLSIITSVAAASLLHKSPLLDCEGGREQKYLKEQWEKLDAKTEAKRNELRRSFR